MSDFMNACRRMYLKGNYRIIPRQVRETNHPEGFYPPLPPPEGSQGVHWVGWFFVERPDEERKAFAVWQDYKKRGFMVSANGTEGPILMRGQTLYDLADGLESLVQKKED